jgi:hypothetical protein
VCDAPHLNASCIVHEHIRDARQDDRERQAAGVPFAELKDWLPPCSRDPGAYAERGYTTIHRDPLEFRNLPAAFEDIPPYSCCPSPYRYMREENFRDVCDAEGLKIRGADQARERGWVYEPDRQQELLKAFWGKLEPARSLIFYYCNQGNPLDEHASRVVVGVGRIRELGQQLFFGKAGRYTDNYPVWSRRVTQNYPDEGVRIPYQEYLAAGRATDDILCRVPRAAIPQFSFVGEHVSDDVAVAVLERMIQCIEQVVADGIV